MQRFMELFYNKKFISQFIAYFFVGMIAAIVEWGTFALFYKTLSFNTYMATSLAFLCATYVNWFVARKTAFKEEAKHKKINQDIVIVFFVSGIGLVFNMLFMWLLVNHLTIYPIYAKIISTGLVFLWNFSSRKTLIYKTGGV